MFKKILYFFFNDNQSDYSSFFKWMMFCITMFEFPLFHFCGRNLLTLMIGGIPVSLWYTIRPVVLKYLNN